MAVFEDGFYLADRVRRACSEGPHGVVPWKGREIHAALERSVRYSGDHQLFYLTFLEGLRELVEEDGDAVLMRFARQALGSESRVLADNETIRDHLTHVTQVFLLGWLILNECGKFRALGEEWKPYDWPRENRFDLLNRAWVYTSLLHDCAYSVERASSARAHEVRVRSMFGRVYEPAVPGHIDPKACWTAGEPLWKRRAGIIGCRISPAVRQELERFHARPDHGFVTAQALLAEAARHAGAGGDVLEVAAASLACHNFRHLVDPQREPAPEVVRWFSLDFWQEPLAGLLTVTDEIQEWGRERMDQAFARDQASAEDLFERVVLTHLAVDDAVGLSIDVRLLFHLLPEDRGNRHRMAVNREQKNATTNRTYSNGFRSRDGHPRTFDLHLRIEETVEDVPCRMGRRFDWPTAGRSSLRRLSEDALKPRASQSATVFRSVRAFVSDATAGDTVIDLAADGAATIRVSDLPSAGLRLVLVEPGGAGKSTVLRALAACRRLGTRTLVTLYVEELGDDLVDLREECEAMRQDAGGADLLLLLDHLDRLVGSSTEAYWLDQIKSLSGASGLHVIGACRPEEYEAIVGLTLARSGPMSHGFDTVNIERAAGTLMEQTDAKGRATARGIERHLRGDSASLDVLGQVALTMREKRHMDRPSFEQAAAATFAGAPAIGVDAGRVRFVHDAVQDYLSAWSLARQLAQPDTGVVAPSRARLLRELPRDVFRLLLDILTNSTRMDRAERRRGACALARGLLQDGTLRMWLYESARLAQATLAVPEFRAAYEDVPDVSTIAEMLEGLRINYDLFHDGCQPEQYRAAVEAFARSLVQLDQVWPGESHRQVDAEVLTVFLVDHLLTVLTRAAVRTNGDAATDRLLGVERGQATELRGLALDVLGSRALSAAPGRFTPAWARDCVARCDPSDPFAGRCLEATDSDIGSVLSGRVLAGEPSAQVPFAVRRCQLAGHVGGTIFLRHVLTLEGFHEYLRWQDRAITRAARVLRAMENPGSSEEQFASIAQGRAAIALARSRVVDGWARGIHVGIQDRVDGWYRLLEAVEAHDAAWRQTKAALRPGERLTVSHASARSMRVLGAVLADADRGRWHGFSAAEAQKSFEKHQQKLLDEHRLLADDHPGFRGHTSVLKDLESRVGDPATFVAKASAM